MKRPDECDICENLIVLSFVDGKTNMGPWACMCLNCHSMYDVGLGTGKGQKYHKQNDDFAKVEG